MPQFIRQFMPNPYFGAFNMPAMPIHYDNMYHAFINQISGNSTNVSSSNSVVIPKVKKLNSEDEVVSKSSKSKESNASKPKVVSNKTGPKTACAPK